MVSVPIDIDKSDEEVMADVHRVWEVCKEVEMGKTPEGDLKEAIRQLAPAARAGAGVGAR
jgi:hypothetical protein